MTNLQKNNYFKIIPADVIKVIAGYTNEYILLNWIELDKLYWYFLSQNPNIFRLNYNEILDELLKI